MIKLFFYILALTPIFLSAQTQEDLAQRIKSNNSAPENISLIQQFGVQDPDYRALQSLYKLLDKKVRKSTNGKFLERYIKSVENSSAGKKAPGITQFDISGEPYSLQDLKGKYVLVSFWASWNTASVSEIPAYTILHAKFKDKNFEILGVSFDSDFKAWKRCVEDNKMTWKHISDLQNMNNAASLSYGIRSIPQNVLVGPDGIIIARNLSSEELSRKLGELIK